MRPFEQDGGGVSASAAGRGHGVSRKVSHDGHDVLLTEVFFPEISEWRPVLERLGVSQQAAIAAAVRAREHACDFQSALLADALADRSDLLRAVAAELGLDVVETIDPERIVITQENAITLLRGRNGRVPVKLMGRSGDVAFLISSERLRLDAMRRQMAAHPSLARHLRLVDPQILRQAILEHARPLLTRRAVTGLGERYPAFSARIVANAWQGMTIGTTMTLVPVGLLLARSSVLAVSHVIATVFFFACVSLRFAAAASIQPPRPPASIPMPEGEKPVYSVLVALYQEAAIVPSLIAALDRLVWPRDRLDIKLVCEEGDTGTLAVIGALELPPHIEVVVVPRRGPKTKPKALAYALQMAGGEFVVLYDAEDSPHPMQLIEAWQRFCQAGPDLAAIQAPLEISNGNANLLARMFAFEYAGLFRGLLPWLSQRRLMLPLGGTSNHFRRATLEHVGGWDPFNVTEDADLGMRLARFGYRTEVMTCPTSEAAPKSLRVWLPQRTRWFKGWTQTWLVHMRNPGRLARDLHFKSFVIAQVLFAGLLASALLHPLLLVTFVYLSAGFALNRPPHSFGSVLLAVDTVNIVCGYLSFLLLGWKTLSKQERRGFWKIVLFTPFYWILLSAAGWRSLWHLCRRPHHWEKTPHEPDLGGIKG